MKALVLAGGYPQIELILELKRRGITTVLADWNKEPVAKFKSASGLCFFSRTKDYFPCVYVQTFEQKKFNLSAASLL